MSGMNLSFLFLSLVCFAAYVDSRPTGAPMAACNTLFPQHGDATNAAVPGDFYIYSELFDNDIGGDFVGNASYRGKFPLAWHLHEYHGSHVKSVTTIKFASTALSR